MSDQPHGAPGTAGGLIGRRLPGRQDRRLLQGRGRYVDDIKAPAALHATVLRSPVAHGHIVSFDASAAVADGRVHLVLDPAEIARLTEPIPVTWQLPGQHLSQVSLAVQTVRYIGQPIGLIVADSRAAAEDAAELVVVDIDPLPAVTSVPAALADGGPLLYPECGSNIAGQIHFGDPVDDLEQIMATAPHVVERTLGVQRINHSPMEPRGILADWTAATEQLTVWSSTQSPHVVRQELAAVLRLRVDQIRVVAPDIGGSFGGKVTLQVDEALVCLAATILGRQVKWIEDRFENLTAAYQGRGQQARARLALGSGGRFLALHADITGDLGAFAIQAGSGPFQVTGLALEGPYRYDRAGATVRAVYTNMVPTGAYRGYGMQEASWIRERLIDEAARELGMDGLDLRLRNIVGPGDMPYTTHTQLTYDGGDYAAALRRAAALAREHCGASAGQVSRGAAATACVEITGFAPSALLEMFHIDWSGWEAGRLRVNQDGTVTAFAGVIPVGQGIETTLAQIVADRLRIPIGWVAIQLGDTDVTPYSDLSSQASRSLTLAGGALVQAADRMRDRMHALASRFLGADPADVSLDSVAGTDASPDKAVFRAAGTEQTVTWRDVAHRGWKGWGRSGSDQIQLEETVEFDPPAITFSYSSHGAAVAVDRETGKVAVTGYWSVNDSGILVNPLIAEGQITGGIAQGIGIALLEEARYDADTAAPLATAYRDYVLPTERDVPPVTIEHRCTPSAHIPGGFRGLGEGGAIPPPATIAGAIADAIPQIAHSLTSTPMTPARIWAALDAAARPGRQAGREHAAGDAPR